MEELTVKGGRPLYGTVRVSGAKNAALPLIFATILTEEECIIENVPMIRDVEISLDILRVMGAEVYFPSRATLSVCTKNMRAEAPPPDLVSELRASTYLMGAMLGRFGRAYVQDFGGCNFSPRPIDLHLYAAAALGARRDGACLLAEGGLSGDRIALRLPSVGATVNALLMAVRAKGETVIENAACEPHVENLIAYLRSMGAHIRREGGALYVKGGPLHGGRVSVVGDMIEAGTYLLSAIATGGRVTVTGCDSTHLSSFLSLLSSGGATVREEARGITVSGRLSVPITVRTAPYPGFPTDLQPQTALVGALCRGAVVTERVFPERFGYLTELKKMGLSFVQSGGSAYLFTSRLHPAAVEAPDLRGGAALVLAALHASGETAVRGAHRVLRGYESIVEKFSELGANITLHQ